MQTTIKSAKNHVLGSALLLLYLLIAGGEKRKNHVGLTSCFGFFDIKKTDPCMSDWHTHCAAGVSAWVNSAAAGIEILCARSQSSVWNPDIRSTAHIWC